MTRQFHEFSLNVSTDYVVDSYRDIVPLLSTGNVEKARNLLLEKYRIGPQTRYSKRPVVVYWLKMMGELQRSFIEERRKGEKSGDEIETIRTTYDALGALVKEFVHEAKEPLADATNRTLLHHAAFFQLTEICEFLLARKYDPNDTNGKGVTPSYEAICGFERLPLCYDEEDDPFRVKELFPTLLNGGADPYYPPGLARSVNERVRTLTKHMNSLMANEEERKKSEIPELERKIGLLKVCYADPLEERRLRKLRGEL